MADTNTERDLDGHVVPDADEISWAAKVLQEIFDNVATVVFGKSEQLEAVLTAFCAKGHILIEDHPGVGKTLLARAFAKSMGIGVGRIQFTPDVVPGDVTGTVIYSRRDEEFKFRAGPVFTNILLADEINRGTPRTQSSLLQAMEEYTVTVEDTSYSLPAPFFVIATQNPLEIHGTFPLPESQLDRFTMRISLGYPEYKTEDQVLRTYAGPTSPIDAIGSIVQQEDVNRLTELTAKIFIARKVRRYILELAKEVRTDSRIKMGVSPRASLSLARAAQGRALMRGRDSVLPDDVRALACNVFAHRMVPYSHSDSPADMLQEYLERVPAPE